MVDARKWTKEETKAICTLLKIEQKVFSKGDGEMSLAEGKKQKKALETLGLEKVEEVLQVLELI